MISDDPKTANLDPNHAYARCISDQQERHQLRRRPGAHQFGERVAYAHSDSTNTKALDQTDIYERAMADLNRAYGNQHTPPSSTPGEPASA